jgi:catechol 2,3-dioxygenase-like lactoylglutathione lyase family enzyme
LSGMSPSEMITWLYVQDMERSVAFYGRGLGLRKVLDQSGCCILRLSNTAYLGLCQRPSTGDASGVLLCFVEEDVDARVELLVAAGATLEQPPASNARYGIYHAFLLDPDGYRLEVQRFDDPGWKSRD